ncbi:DUF6338 family protein [Arthrobacter sp. MMS18-M83]|uniref:DUF6338 family protein n=1 Tax=Arthrobacter sp. MMS18-M83 TaxID=2996261 RepID=UPI00227A6050|nr:DUF6338 family protein [Arthrobacter sp. MMS18-M83]WAH97760.1 DUF6338 family protein [Arthrobacter sp. MMS18-M83]
MPTSAFGVLVFILAVAPGFYYELVRGRRYTRTKESAFYEASRAVVASVVLGVFAGALAFLFWLYILSPEDPPDVTALLKRDPQYLGAHTRQLVGGLAVYLVASFLFARLWMKLHGLYDRAKAKFPWLSQGVTSSHSLWTEVLQSRAPKGHISVARVRMKSGEIWVGPVLGFSTEHELADRELVLHQPIHFASSKTPTALSPTPFSSIILKGPEIEMIAVVGCALDEKLPKSHRRKRGRANLQTPAAAANEASNTAANTP